MNRILNFKYCSSYLTLYVRILSLILFISPFQNSLSAQDDNRDSIEIDEMIEKSHYQLSQFEYNSSIEIAKNALEKSIQIKYSEGMINNRLLIGQAYKFKHEYAESLIYYLQAQSDIEKHGDRKDNIYLNEKLGELFYEWRVPEKALIYYKKALSLYVDTDHNKSNFLVLRITELNTQLGYYQSALNDYIKLISEPKNAENTDLKLNILKKIATIQGQINDHESALQTNMDILKINIQRKDSANVAIAFNKIGFLYKDLNEPKKALEYFRLALNINELTNRNGANDNNIVSNLINMGIINQSLNDYRNSIKMFNEALEIKKKRGTPVEVAVMHNYLASINYNLGKFKEAKVHSENAISFLQDTNNKKLLATNYKRLSDIYKKTNEYQLALKNYEQYSIIKDSLLYREQLYSENEKYKHYVAEATEKESKLSIIDKEMRELEIQNEMAHTVQQNQEIQLLLREKELQNFTLKTEQLEQEKKVQELLFQQEQIALQSKDQEITLLEKDRNLQSIEIQKQELEEKERLKEIELQKSKLELQKSDLEKSEVRQSFLIYLSVLFLTILILILYGYLIKQRDNKKLQTQYLEINNQKGQIEKINEELVELNEEKNDLIGIVAHDLKSPLNQISGMLEIIKLTAEDQTKEQQEYISKIDQSTNRLKKMVTKILDVSAIESNKLNVVFEKLDLKIVLDDTIERFKEQAAKKSITINKEFELDSAFSSVDIGFVSEVFENLLSNAVKYSPLEKKVRVSLLEKNGKNRIAFVDEGQGINEKDMKKLFGKYHKLTARPTAGEDSTGLGLSIVKKYVEALDGEVWCESEEGKGASFYVEFPSLS